MTKDVEAELRGPEVSLVSGLEGVGGLHPQEVTGALWEGRKLVGWEQFWIYITIRLDVQQRWGVVSFLNVLRSEFIFFRFVVCFIFLLMHMLITVFYSLWRIRLFSFLWSSLWHSSPERQEALHSSICRKRLQLHVPYKDTLIFTGSHNRSIDNGFNAFLPHCCKQHTLRKYTGPVERQRDQLGSIMYIHYAWKRWNPSYASCWQQWFVSSKTFYFSPQSNYAFFFINKEKTVYCKIALCALNLCSFLLPFGTSFNWFSKVWQS